MSYSEAMAKHYQDKRKDINTNYQLKYANTYFNKNLVTIHSNFKLDGDSLSLVNKIIRRNGDSCDYFVDSIIYSDEYMKERNEKLARAETVDELVAYLDDLDEGIQVIRSDNHVEKGLELDQWSSIDGIHLKTCFYI